MADPAAEKPVPAIAVRCELYAAAPDAVTSEWRALRYVNGTGLRRVEHRRLQRESDWTNAEFERFSEDNGRSWGDWRDIQRRGCARKGDDEITVHHGTEAYNPRHGHFVSVGMRRIFFGGHRQAYERYWGRGEAAFVDHCLIMVRPDGRDERASELVRYEPGADYDPANWRDPAYTDRNRAYFGCVDVLDNGEILFPIAANVRACCRILGRDLQEVFPSCPDIMCGMIVVRGRLDEARGGYDLTFSRPVVISDLLSSRGVCEPDVIQLPSGRILAVFRGSNVSSPNWRTRIEPGTPSHKWYCCSDDGGRTFTEPAPWHFDNREVFYSPASIGRLFRSRRNGQVYWIGNITDHTAYGNDPRYPLVIAAVNDRGLLVKHTLSIIDTREPGDGEKLHLSNFSILQDRETGTIELYLSKLGQRPDAFWQGDCYRYLVDVGPQRES